MATAKLAKEKAQIQADPAETNVPHKWQFKARFRRQAFGWKTQPAATRIREAVSEIKKVARKEPVLAGEGAVLFLERLVPAIEQVDGSSGAIGTAVNKAIEALVPIIAKAPASGSERVAWLERLTIAQQNDGYGYLTTLGDYWGELCATKEEASKCADGLRNMVRLSLDPNFGGCFSGTEACLSALYKAERYDELRKLIKLDTKGRWEFQQYVIKLALLED